MNKLTVHQWKSKKVIDLAFECPFEVTHEGEVVFVCVLKEQYIPDVNSVKGPPTALQDVNKLNIPTIKVPEGDVSDGLHPEGVPEPKILSPEETMERRRGLYRKDGSPRSDNPETW